MPGGDIIHKRCRDFPPMREDHSLLAEGTKRVDPIPYVPPKEGP